MTSDEEKTGRVLVVDDESAICRIVTRTLERNGFSAESVSVVGELESALQASEFDVILLDRSMTRADGSSLLSTVREHAPQAKVLYFTGDLVGADEMAAVDGVVQKPINGKELAKTIRQIL